MGALTEAIEQWKGGVVVISHNLAFCEKVATEKWIMDAGHLRAEGGEYVDVKIDDKGGADEFIDGSGNAIAVNRAKTLTDKEIKKAIKDVGKKLKENEKKKILSDDEPRQLQDKLAELSLCGG